MECSLDGRELSQRAQYHGGAACRAALWTHADSHVLKMETRLYGGRDG